MVNDTNTVSSSSTARRHVTLKCLTSSLNEHHYLQQAGLPVGHYCLEPAVAYPPLTTLAARLYRSIVSSFSISESPWIRLTSFRVNPVIIETRDAVCFLLGDKLFHRHFYIDMFARSAMFQTGCHFSAISGSTAAVVL